MHQCFSGQTHARWVIAWLALTLGFNLLWEAAQVPFYTLWHEGNWTTIAFAVIHCTAGDVLIAASVFAAVSVVLGRTNWIVFAPRKGQALAVTLGLAYTVWSEDRNISAGAWAYATSMPKIAGIGVLPMLQWIGVPIATWGALRSLFNR